MNIAKSLAFDMNIESILLTKRCLFRKKQFKYNQLRSPLKVNYFLVVVDMEIASLKDRFDQLKIF